MGNIYKGVVVNLEPSIQAAFVDFGVGRNGFLHISDVEPQYFRQGGYEPDEPIGSGRPRGPRARGRAGKPTRRWPTRSKTSRWTSEPAAAPPSSRRPPPLQAAHPGDPPPRRRSARPGDQGGHRHQGPHAVDLYQHPRPIPGAHAGAGPHRRVAEDRGRRSPPPPARHHARAESAPRRGLHRPHRRHATAPNASSPATWPTCCGCGRSSCGGSRNCPPRWTSTKKAT